jgi:hypothetical protein
VNASASGKMSRVTKRVIILGADRMPISAIGRDGDFRYEVRARKRDAWSSLGRLISRAGVYDFEANRPSGARTELDQANVLTFTLTSMPSSSSPLPQ